MIEEKINVSDVISALKTIKRFCEQREECKHCCFGFGWDQQCALLDCTPSRWKEVLEVSEND